jgi:hypothetical protein
MALNPESRKAVNPEVSGFRARANARPGMTTRSFSAAC